jgi:hypothetical protein
MIDSRASFVRLIETDDAQGHKAEAVMPLGLILKNGKRFPEGIVPKQERPAAIRLAGRNGQSARDLKRRDGRHPKTGNHGRIAGC